VVRVAVIGAGAAGLMAALHAARAGARVTVLERTRDGGRKILISGGGRCNILPAVLEERRFVTDSSRPAMAKLLRGWPLASQRAFFEDDLGLPLTLEPGTGKLFPTSNRARDVRDRLLAAVGTAGGEIRFGVTVRDLRAGPDGWSVVADEGGVGADRVVLATGGLSVPSTGSDGIGLAVAERLGHRINSTYPALTPLLAEPPVHASLAGVSLPVRAAGRWDHRRADSAGGFLFTHKGYSGPAVLDVSHLAVRSRLAGDARAEIEVAWGGETEVTWEDRLRSQSRKTVATAIRSTLPGRLADRLVQEAAIASDRTLSQLTRDERRRLVTILTAYRLPWTGDEGYRKAEVTGGGVALGEIDPVTLESRRTPGLHLCGELLDAFGPIGGYNFAWAWATGRQAGLGAAGSGRPPRGLPSDRAPIGPG
jgi:hypothetical protein